MRPPWRNAPPGEKGKYVGFTILGFAVPWLVVAIAAVLFIFFVDRWTKYPQAYPIAITIALLAIVITLAIDMTGAILATTVRSPVVRCLGWGALIALLTHVIVFAIYIIVAFGICISQLGNGG